MSDTITLAFEQRPVRAFSRDGEPWFVLRDVCEALGITNARNVAARLEEDEKGVELVDTLGGPQRLTVVNEAGIYAAAQISRKPEARRFCRWVRHEVLPEIRRTGSYGRPTVNLRDPAQLALVAAQLHDLLIEERSKVAELQPAADAYERLAGSRGAMSITEAAKTLRVRPRELGEMMHARGWIYRRTPTSSWLAYQGHIGAGFLEHRALEIGRGDDPALPGKVVTQVLVTAKGLTRLARLVAGVSDAPQAALPLAPTSAHAA